DLECETGDLDEIFTHKRTQQAGLFARLGEFETAIKYYEESNRNDVRKFRYEDYIKNMLGIVDSYLGLGERKKAQEEFMNLLNALMPDELELGNALPSIFTQNFEKLRPYFGKVGFCENLEKVIRYAEARFENLKQNPEAAEDSFETRGLARLLITYYVSSKRYNEASDIIETARKIDEHAPFNYEFSRVKQAEYMVKAGNNEKAEEFLREAESDMRDAHGLEAFNRQFDIAALYLQLGKVDKTLEQINEYCDEHKGSLVIGSYSKIHEARRLQIQIMKAVIGNDYAQKIREYSKTKEPIKVLEAHKIQN
ncbi:unnamed protein product, partial [marine sediment metagenome]